MAKKRTLKGLIIGLLLILVGVAGAGFGLWRLGSTWLENSRWSRLERVQVAGLVRVTERDVLRAANLKAGMNIMQLPLEAIASRVERVPGVRSARVLRKIPHRVQIRIEERQAIACIQSGSIWLVDEDGVLFPTVGPGEVVDIPVLTGEVDPGKKGQPGLRTAVAFVNKVKTAYPGVYAHLGEVSVQGGKLGFRLKEGGATVLSVDPTSPATLVKLEQFLQQRRGELSGHSQYVDLRYPAMVVTGTAG